MHQLQSLKLKWPPFSQKVSRSKCVFTKNCSFVWNFIAICVTQCHFWCSFAKNQEMWITSSTHYLTMNWCGCIYASKAIDSPVCFDAFGIKWFLMKWLGNSMWIFRQNAVNLLAHYEDRALWNANDLIIVHFFFNQHSFEFNRNHNHIWSVCV